MMSRFHSDKPAGLDSVGFLALYRERWEALLRFFVRRTFDPEVAADLTAETFAEAFASRARFDPRRGDASAWLFGIARHELGSYLRTLNVECGARERLGLPARVLSVEDYDRIEALIDFAEVGRQLQVALQRLAPEQREAVVYRIVDGASYAEIAERLGCSQDAVRTRVSRGLKTLAQIIGQLGDGAEGAPA
jgi:RNA polymerase sigma factor (sigma-70 family)